MYTNADFQISKKLALSPKAIVPKNMLYLELTIGKKWDDSRREKFLLYI